MNRALKIFIGEWIFLALCVNAVAIVGMFMQDGFWGGIGREQETYSPFHVLNFIMQVVLLSPALLAYWYFERRNMHNKFRQIDEAISRVISRGVINFRLCRAMHTRPAAVDK